MRGPGASSTSTEPGRGASGRGRAMTAELVYRGAVLVVDDEPAEVEFLRGVVKRAGGRVRGTSDAGRAMELFGEIRPDLVLLDLQMPGEDGFALMDALRDRVPHGEYLPMVVLTADVGRDLRERALHGGAADFLVKPLVGEEVLRRVTNLLEARRLHLELRGGRAGAVEGRVWELEQAQVEILERLGRAAEFRDDATGSHARRVGDLSAMLARSMEVPEEEVELIWRAAPLHDVGKIAVPDGVLLKPGPLSEEEWVVLRRHPTVGSMILSGSHFPVLQMAEEIALSHHERWDGTGYPRGLRGEEIPIASRIVALVDCFDALVRERPYKPAWPPEEAIAEIIRQRGRHFDPQVVDAFLEIWRMEGGILPEAHEEALA
jgi:putative two-component system response regulator